MKNPVMSNNAFVKGVGNKIAAKMGDQPVVPAAMKRFDAYMSNDGEAARKSTNKLTAGLEDAFPINKNLTVE